MPPSSRRAAMRAVTPQRAQGFLLAGSRAAHAWQIRPFGPMRSSGMPVRWHCEHPGETTSTWPASASTWARRTMTAGQRGSPEVSASGRAARCSSRCLNEAPESALAAAKAAQMTSASSSGTAALRAATIRDRRPVCSAVLRSARVRYSLIHPGGGLLSAEPAAPEAQHHPWPC